MVPNMLQEGDKKCFTFTWAIENFDMCPQEADRRLTSPTFVVNTLGGRNFQLWLYPRGWKSADCISCYAVRKPGKPKHNVKVASTFKVRTTDGSIFKRAPIQYKILDNDDVNVIWGVQYLQSRGVMFEQKNIYLQGNTLTLEFEIWRTDGEDNPIQCAGTSDGLGSEGTSLVADTVSTRRHASGDQNETCYWKTYSNKCFARTRIGGRKCSLLWPVKLFPSLSRNCALCKLIYFVEDEEHSFQLAFYLSGESRADQRGQIEIRRKSTRDAPPVFLKSKITVVDAHESRIYHEQEEDNFFRSSDKEKIVKLSSSVNLNELRQQKYFESAKGVLYLRCQLASSTECDNLHVKDILTLLCKSARVDTEAFGNVLANDLKRAYEESKLCDVVLRCGSQEYRVHKVILCARSRVISAMFENVKQEDSGVVDITDVDSKTLGRMLDFLYSDQLGDMHLADCISLYKAADKYGIHSLKSRCAGILICCLTVSSVCEVLELSDTHRDYNLMDSVQDFIHFHKDEVFGSQEWGNWSQFNSQLAVDIMIKEWIMNMYKI